jgi:hypothetical protein
MSALEDLSKYLHESYPQVKMDEVKIGIKKGYIITSEHPMIIYIGGVREDYGGEFAFWDACRKEMQSGEEEPGEFSNSESKILKYLKVRPRTVRELSKITGYTINTVRISVKSLQTQGLINKGDKVENHSGRGHPSYLFYAVGINYPKNIKIR